MAQEKTEDEVQGRAEQLEFKCNDMLMQRHEDFKAEELRSELDLIPADEFARAINVAEQTLATWRSAGEGPAYVKLGKTVFYRRADLKVWIGNCATAKAA